MRVGAAGGGGACSARSGVTACDGVSERNEERKWEGRTRLVRLGEESGRVGGQRGSDRGEGSNVPADQHSNSLKHTCSTRVSYVFLLQQLPN